MATNARAVTPGCDTRPYETPIGPWMNNRSCSLPRVDGRLLDDIIFSGRGGPSRTRFINITFADAGTNTFRRSLEDPCRLG